MTRPLKRVLFVTAMCPTRSRPARGPFIGHRIAGLVRAGVRVDVLNPVRYRHAWQGTPPRILAFFFFSFVPLVRVETACFRGARYRVFNFYYTVFSRYWLWVFVFLLDRARKYDLLHYHFLWYTEELAFLKKILRRPAVVSVRGSDMNHDAVNLPASRARFRAVLARADRVVYVSRALRDIAISLRLDTERDIVIPNGYDPEIFHPTHVPSGKLVFGFVGLLIKRKRAEKLPEIFGYINESIPGARLLIVGDGILRSMIEAEFAARGLSGALEFAGEVRPEEVARYYARMHVLLFPSRNEGFPNVPHEARACGVPVAGSSNTGIPEAVGKGGVIVEEGPDFERRFAAAAVALARNLPAREVIAAGMRGLEWQGIVDREMAVYRELL